MSAPSPTMNKATIFAQVITLTKTINKLPKNPLLKTNKGEHRFEMNIKTITGNHQQATPQAPYFYHFPPPPAPPLLLLPGRCDRKDCQVHEAPFLQDVCSVIDHDGAAVVHGVGSFAPPPCSGPHTEGPLQGPEPARTSPFLQRRAADDDRVATVNESLDGLAIRRGDDHPHLQDIVEVHHDFGADSLHSFSQKGLASSPFFKGTASILGGLKGRLSAGGLSRLRGGRLGAALLRGRLFLDLGQRWALGNAQPRLGIQSRCSLSSYHCFLSFFQGLP